MYCMQVCLQWLSVAEVTSIWGLTCHTKTSCSLRLPVDTQPCVTLAQGTKKKKREEEKSGFMKWLIGRTAAAGLRPRILQCYHRKTGLSVSDWHWIGGHGGLTLTLFLSDLRGETVVRGVSDVSVPAAHTAETFISRKRVHASKYNMALPPSLHNLLSSGNAGTHVNFLQTDATLHQNHIFTGHDSVLLWIFLPWTFWKQLTCWGCTAARASFDFKCVSLKCLHTECKNIGSTRKTSDNKE